jgi:hypothetical protein
MHPSPAPDPSLRALLRRADPGEGMPGSDTAAFAAAVHTRIRASDTAPSETWHGRLARGLELLKWHGRPAHGLGNAFSRQLLPLAAALAVLASLGVGSATAYARHERDRTERYASALARSIDPWLMHAARAETPSAPSAHRH